jgi:uncharacterized membrane protein
MSWLVFAFSGPVLWAISTHFDKYLVERYFKHSDVTLLLLFTAFMGVAILPVIAFFEPSAIELPAGSIALILVSGLLYMTGLLFYLRAIQSEEASVVAPFFQVTPLFGYVLAYVVLGETLSARQLAGGGLIIAGTLIVSIRFDRKLSRFKARLVLLMLSCGLAMAVSGLIFKLFALRVDFWATTFWLFVGEAIFGAALLAIAAYRRGFIAVLRQDTAALLAISGSNELFNLGGTVGSRYALLFAPLSIVQAIGSTTTLFVFGFGVLLSVFYPQVAREELSVRELAQKAVAAVVVAIGVTLVTR